MLKNKLKVKIKGRGSKYFIQRIISNKIDLLNVNYLTSDEINVIIYEQDYLKIINMKTTYEISIIKYYGWLRIKHILKFNMIFIITTFIGYIFLILLSNIIFEVKIIHEDSNVRNFLRKDLEEFGIRKWTIKKNYEQLNKIKTKILKKRENQLEWLEINVVGVRYTIRVEERKLNVESKHSEPRNIVAAKDAIIKRISVEKGQKVKEINDSVQKGEIIISGSILKGEEVKSMVPATGKVYGEVWYEVKVVYPLVYRETTYTDNIKKTINLKIINKNITLFDFKPYKSKKIKEKHLLTNKILPIYITKQTQREVVYREQILTEAEAITKAQAKAKKTMRDRLTLEENILEQKTLKIDRENSRIVIYEFFSILENIGKEEVIIIEPIDPIE